MVDPMSGDAVGGWKSRAAGSVLEFVVVRTLKYLWHFMIVAILALLVGMLANAHLEISLKRPSTATSWRDLVDIDLDLAKPTVYQAYYGDNIDRKTALTTAVFSLRHFKLANKVTGTKERVSDKARWAISGFRREDLTVLTHRGLVSGGEGVYVLRHFSRPEISPEILVGFAIFEDIKDPMKDEVWVIKCPFLMVPRSAASARYDTPERMMGDFPFMGSRCHEFKTVRSLSDLVEEPGSIDEILARK